MNEFAGIPISEWRLLVETVVFTLLFVAALVAFGFAVYTQSNLSDRRKRQHLHRLKERAKTDETARLRLEKQERKQKARQKRNRRNNLYDIFILILCGGLCLALLLLTVIPGWTDYCRKDYVVYSGEFSVYAMPRHSRIRLPDGTTIWGRGYFDTEDTDGTLVYARRSKILMGIQE